MSAADPVSEYAGPRPSAVGQPGTSGSAVGAGRVSRCCSTSESAVSRTSPAPNHRPNATVTNPHPLVSPWTRGGWVSSEVFDHTSLIQFLEHWTTTLGKPAICENISEWRRTVCGDLTSAIDFGSVDLTRPDLPDVDVLAAAAEADRALPSVAQAVPAAGQQSMPVPPPGSLRVRPVPYRQHATVTVDRASGVVEATLSNGGS